MDQHKHTAYAHTMPGAPPTQWEPLETHLEEVASLAAELTAAFGSEAWGYLAGLWHDLGKYRPEFQARLRGSGQRIEHAGVGAALAMEKGGPGSGSLAYAIAGHHAGLANRSAQSDSGMSPLVQRVARNQPVLQAIRDAIPRHLIERALPAPPEFLGKSKSPTEARRWEMWTRMLFSALVDADRLASERFSSPGQAQLRALSRPTIDALRRRLDEYLTPLKSRSEMGTIRHQILESCRRAASLDRGLFSLTAPTGTGKTLSAMAFGLSHASRHALRRVIVAVPYTSIIEQNAEEYRRALGSDAVIEHHSNVDGERREEDDGPLELRRRFAAENWDAPIIVTTTVQLFESLLSNRPSRCRRIHNVASSAIILDEAQSLPPQFLTCILDVMQTLVVDYGCSIVISTATQPALGSREGLPGGLVGIREIVDEPLDLARIASRTRVRWPAPASPAVSYESLADEMMAERTFLAIVHLRKDARHLARLLHPDGRYHLSALMCPAHRSLVLDQVRAALRSGSNCRTVATQLVEAGVDIDFPVVYRALAGLDSIAQAAGRCNREWLAPEGQVHVFRAPTQPPQGVLRAGAQITDGLLRARGPLDLSDLNLFQEYFRALFQSADLDRSGIQVERADFNFANVDARMNMVEDGYLHAVVVPWGESSARLAGYREAPNRESARAMQRYVVQVSPGELSALSDSGAIEAVNEDLWCITPPYNHLYDNEFGLVVENIAADPSVLVQ